MPPLPCVHASLPFKEIIVSSYEGCVDKKKIDKSINFLRGWEKKIVSIFCLRSCEQVGVSLGPNGAGPEIDT